MQKTPTLGWTFEVFTFTADCKLDFTDCKLDFEEALKISYILLYFYLFGQFRTQQANQSLFST
ncbi:hypothetical protein LguiB_001649 [Lonicera macranthoides]